MRLLFIGDVVGSLGRNTVSDYLPKLKKKYRPQVTIVNGENAASGRGITEKIYKKFLQDGADVITLGNHAWDNRGIFEFIEDAKRMVRPANFPTGVPGVGVVFDGLPFFNCPSCWSLHLSHFVWDDFFHSWWNRKF